MLAYAPAAAVPTTTLVIHGTLCIEFISISSSRCSFGIILNFQYKYISNNWFGHSISFHWFYSKQVNNSNCEVSSTNIQVIMKLTVGILVLGLFGSFTFADESVAGGGEQQVQVQDDLESSAGGHGWSHVPVVHGKTTYSQGPTVYKQYHYHQHKTVPSHEVKHFQSHSSQAKKIIHQHNQDEKVIHQHHHHQHTLHAHHLHKVHLHNLHQQAHHIHQHNLHKQHVHQPIYHQHHQNSFKETQEHKHKQTYGESHEHKHSFHESKSHAPPVYKGWQQQQQNGWGR